MCERKGDLRGCGPYSEHSVRVIRIVTEKQAEVIEDNNSKRIEVGQIYGPVPHNEKEIANRISRGLLKIDVV